MFSRQTRFIARRPGTGSHADHAARFNRDNEVPARILRFWRFIEWNALQRLGKPFPKPAFQAIALSVRM